MQNLLIKGLHKRFMILTVALFIMAPMVAHSYTLTTRINSLDGQIQVASYPVQTSGSVLRSIPNVNPDVPVVITPAAGYVITKVQLGATYLAVTPAGQTVTIPANTTTSQTINVWFDKALVSVTASTGIGGSVSPSGTQNLQQGSTAVFVFTPGSGNKVISISGTPAGATCNGGACSGPWATNTVVTVNFPVPATTVTMNGVFLGVIANAGSPQNVLTGSTVTLDGSASTGAVNYTWSQTTGTPVTLRNTTTPFPIFPATATGSFQFKLVVDDGAGNSSTAYTTVIVSGSAAAAARAQCYVCHLPLGIGVAQDVFARWSSSKHKNNVIMCYSCHIGANTGGHPGPPLPTLYNVCGTCHFDASGTVPLHPIDIGVNTCVTCHDPHSAVGSLTTAQSAHYNNITSGTYPASYVTSRAACTDCHFSNTSNGVIRHEWAISGHSATTSPAWMAYDFKTRSGCVQCHTTTGFIAYSSGQVTSAWGDAADKTKEVLRCNGCHSDISNGTVRTFTPVSPYANDAYTNPDVGKSNICLSCHSGRKNGTSITMKLAANAAFSNMSFIDPHYMATGGTLYGVGGYQFPGRTYTPDFTKNHQSIDSVDTNNSVLGPCITCHKNAFFDHTFRPTWSTNPLCSSCHTNMTDAQLSGSKTALANALEVLRAQLAAKGFVYSPTYPYFSNTNWGLGVAGANTMGAAFNYILLLREPGAYAHNPSYANQLVLDSIDYLDNGVIDDSFSTVALPGLLASGAISQAVADSFSIYKAKNLCTTCHGGTAATASPMSSSVHPAHLTSVYGPGLYLGGGVSSCQVCHVYGSATHMNGIVDLMNGAGSACLGCHAGTTPSWNTSARLDCTTCHAATPAVLPNGIAAPYKGNFSTTGHGRFPASSQCTVCHDPDSRHISGSLGSYTRLRLLNDNNLCASCHNNASIVGAAALNMNTHVTIDGRTLACRDCHDPHGTSNLAMIRTTINGTSIVFTDNFTGLVDLVTNRGLCQACHTLTNHYKAGVPETNHFTSGCLNCHAHNSVGGAFRPTDGACDSCHGYPPANVNFTGTQGNWSSARRENYPGGGGAHTIQNHVSKLVKPSEGFSNCTKCHNAADHKTSPIAFNPSQNIKVSINQSFRIVSAKQARYTSNRLDASSHLTGTCSNISCHFGATPKWDITQ